MRYIRIRKEVESAANRTLIPNRMKARLHTDALVVPLLLFLQQIGPQQACTLMNPFHEFPRIVQLCMDLLVDHVVIAMDAGQHSGQDWDEYISQEFS